MYKTESGLQNLVQPVVRAYGSLWVLQQNGYHESAISTGGERLR